MASLKRQILRRLKTREIGTNVKLDLFINGEGLEQADDRKLLSQIPLRDKMVCTYVILHFDYVSSLESKSDIII